MTSKQPHMFTPILAPEHLAELEREAKEHEPTHPCTPFLTAEHKAELAAQVTAHHKRGGSDD